MTSIAASLFGWYIPRMSVKITINFSDPVDPDAFVRHYRTVADASPVPVLLYNFTALTGVTIPPSAVAELSAPAD